MSSTEQPPPYMGRDSNPDLLVDENVNPDQAQNANPVATVVMNVHADVIVSGNCMWLRDDFPLWGPAANELGPEEKALLEWMVPRRGIVSDGITFYIYCRNIAAWAQLESLSASSELLSVTGINAPVNYDTALARIYPILRRVAYPIRPVRRSVCIGTWRLTYVVRYGTEAAVVRFAEHQPVVENVRGPEYKRTYMFVTSPITMPHPYACPIEVTASFKDPIMNAILLPLRDDQKLDFMWRIGRAIVDPRVDPCVIVLYGPEGHEGKTTLAKNISRMLAETVAWMSEDLIGSTSKWPDSDTVMRLCEKRILICDECDIGDGFNYNNIKRWTSNAPISIKGRTGFLCQTIIAISNKIPFYEKSAINNSIGRRVVIYHMKKKLGNREPLPESAFNNNTLFTFMSLCLTILDAYPRPPVSLPIALYTLFRKNVNRITAGLVYDVGSSSDECIVATSVMALRCGVPIDRLCGAVQALSPELVTTPTDGPMYMNSFRPLKRKLTEHGNELVINDRGRTVYDIEKLIEVVKLV